MVPVVRWSKSNDAQRHEINGLEKIAKEIR